MPWSWARAPSSGTIHGLPFDTSRARIRFEWFSIPAAGSVRAIACSRRPTRPRCSPARRSTRPRPARATVSRRSWACPPTAAGCGSTRCSRVFASAAFTRCSWKAAAQPCLCFWRPGSSTACTSRSRRSLPATGVRGCRCRRATRSPTVCAHGTAYLRWAATCCSTATCVRPRAAPDRGTMACPRASSRACYESRRLASATRLCWAPWIPAAGHVGVANHDPRAAAVHVLEPAPMPIAQSGGAPRREPESRPEPAVYECALQLGVAGLEAPVARARLESIAELRERLLGCTHGRGAERWTETLVAELMAVEQGEHLGVLGLGGLARRAAVVDQREQHGRVGGGTAAGELVEPARRDEIEERGRCHERAARQLERCEIPGEVELARKSVV